MGTTKIVWPNHGLHDDGIKSPRVKPNVGDTQNESNYYWYFHLCHCRYADNKIFWIRKMAGFFMFRSHHLNYTGLGCVPFTVCDPCVAKQKYESVVPESR